MKWVSQTLSVLPIVEILMTALIISVPSSMHYYSSAESEFISRSQKTPFTHARGMPSLRLLLRHTRLRITRTSSQKYCRHSSACSIMSVLTRNESRGLLEADRKDQTDGDESVFDIGAVLCRPCAPRTNKHRLPMSGRVLAIHAYTFKAGSGTIVTKSWCMEVYIASVLYAYARTRESPNGRRRRGSSA